MNRSIIGSLAICSVFIISSCKKIDNPVDEKHIVTTSASDITMVSAQLNGSVSSADMLKAADVGFILSTSSDLKDGIQIMSDGNDGDKVFFAKVADLTVSTTYYYKAILKGGSYYLEGDVKMFTTKPFAFAAVDLGLSVKWANANLGANAHYEAGDLFSWGETETKTNYTYANYKWGNGADTFSEFRIIKYCSKSGLWSNLYWGGSGAPDGIFQLAPEDDAANVKLGDGWRIPTLAEIQELRNTMVDSNYQWTWLSIGGHIGLEVVYLLNGNSVFFPATEILDGRDKGFYWGNSVVDDDPRLARAIEIGSMGFSQGSAGRASGRPIRPVKE